MSDTLTLIDQAIAAYRQQRCAGPGCAHPITDRSPSPYFCGDRCQWNWYNDRNPDARQVYRTPDAAEHATWVDRAAAPNAAGACHLSGPQAASWAQAPQVALTVQQQMQRWGQLMRQWNWGSHNCSQPGCRIPRPRRQP